MHYAILTLALAANVNIPANVYTGWDDRFAVPTFARLSIEDEPEGQNPDQLQVPAQAVGTKRRSESPGPSTRVKRTRTGMFKPLVHPS